MRLRIPGRNCGRNSFPELATRCTQDEHSRYRQIHRPQAKPLPISEPATSLRTISDGSGLHELECQGRNALWPRACSPPAPNLGDSPPATMATRMHAAKPLCDHVRPTAHSTLNCSVLLAPVCTPGLAVTPAEVSSPEPTGDRDYLKCQ